VLRVRANRADRLLTIEPIIGDALNDGIRLRGIGLESLVDKDLRTLLSEPVEGALNISYCGAGYLATCATDLWAAIETALQEGALELGDNLSRWRRKGIRTEFIPNLIPDNFRSTNRSSYQQALESAPGGSGS
tara:strand:- start:6 stop:404 length:399 start_codon:yes stop_codon:yes gene_type:complete